MNPFISQQEKDLLIQRFNASSKNQLAMNAVSAGGIRTVGINRKVLSNMVYIFSDQINTPDVCNQKETGRCWLFAGLNYFRLEARTRLNVEQFEFSQTYLMFWDKLEKANYFLENMIETAGEDLDSRLMAWLLNTPLQDAGQWDMFVGLVQKYGVLPKVLMPESINSEKTVYMNRNLNAKLREFAAQIREAMKRGALISEIRSMKEEMLSDIYRILCIYLGQPAEEFEWAWRDKDGQYHRDSRITPKEFYQKYVGYDLEDYVCLINAPTQDKPFNKTYTVDYLGNVVGGRKVKYLNIDIQLMKQLAIQSIKDDHAVWFGCDVGQMSDPKSGILSMDIWDYENFLDVNFGLDKAERLDYGESMMTHAMLITAVDLDEQGSSKKWRIENSWGDTHGEKGHFLMTDAWFDEFVYEIAVQKKYLPEYLQEALKLEPIILPPWDPMGALA
jgi:bleomycin hydrolase